MVCCKDVVIKVITSLRKYLQFRKAHTRNYTRVQKLKFVLAGVVNFKKYFFFKENAFRKP